MVEWLGKNEAFFPKSSQLKCTFYIWQRKMRSGRCSPILCKFRCSLVLDVKTQEMRRDISRHFQGQEFDIQGADQSQWGSKILWLAGQAASQGSSNFAKASKAMWPGEDFFSKDVVPIWWEGWTIQGFESKQHWVGRFELFFIVWFCFFLLSCV